MINTVLIVPTGIGAEIGGHAGDANPVAKLLASVSDTLITHPNVLNASDINEMTENTLYVEGSILDSFLEGSVNLKRVQMNKILLAVNAPVDNATINSVNAAINTLGADIEILELKTPLKMRAIMAGGLATGEVEGWQELVEQVADYDFDALAIATKIDVPDEVALDYFKNSGVNPWGGVEAKASRLIAEAIGKPVAHAPFGDTLKSFNDVVDPRAAAELVSVSYLHCILKGLHKAPRPVITGGMSIKDVQFMVSPAGCFGRPHNACMKAGIPIIEVMENRTVFNYKIPGAIQVNNYWEAAGVIACARAGVSSYTVRRPATQTKIHRTGD